MMIYLENTNIRLPEHLQNNESTFRQPENGVYLGYDGAALYLAKTGEKGRVCVDFTAGAAAYRRTKGGGELIAKAVHHTSRPFIWDATGGLGRDGFVLAGLGLQVWIFEQNAAVFALLQDGLQRAARQPETAKIISRIQLHFGNAVTHFDKMTQHHIQPDVVYLDPMYPERQKSAAVKKEMAYFHELVGLPDRANDAALFQAALATAQKRIVVKRPRLGEVLCGKPPAYRYTGQSTRFDVYLPC